MFGHLPEGILSQHGYLGCISSLELGQQSVNPLTDAVVPSQEVAQGCKGKIPFENLPQCILSPLKMNLNLPFKLMESDCAVYFNFQCLRGC